MKYKLIAVDMDGTLLNSNKQITPETADAISKAEKKGVLFVVSTGRPIQGVKQYQQLCSLRSPAITYNGAMIVRVDTGEVLSSVNLESADVETIYELGCFYQTTICIWADNQLFVNILNDKAYAYGAITNIKPQLITNLVDVLNLGVTKVLWYDLPENLNKWQREIDNSSFKSVTYCTSQPHFLEFFNKKASKAIAMEKLGEIYGIKREEMIAVGDGFNDLDMLEYAGLGVAMANAPDEVKGHADYVTLTNDEDGVAAVVKKFIS